MLLVVTLVPVLLVVLLYVATPDHRDPKLTVDVTIGPRAWPNEASPDARLVPCIILRNPTDAPWQNVNLSINEQYYFYHPDPIPAGGEVVIPLKFFHTKGSTYFHPENQPLTSLTIFAQIPSGARAIAHLKGPELRSTIVPGSPANARSLP
ncbi:MAG: hypothetical protein D6753_10755 [Planctomycetota bacterium]|nr:MAG: hypothetical protein D6753_10755 [Planctomycetota bacterium]